MVTSDILETAIQIAVKAHAGQKDKGGNAYILHPLWVMHQMPTLELQVLAVLHDVLEDTSVTAAYLRRKKIPSSLITVLAEFLTRKKGEHYDHYMLRLSKNPLACLVKIADLQHNLKIERLETINQEVLTRTWKYQTWLGILQKASHDVPL